MLDIEQLQQLQYQAFIDTSKDQKVKVSVDGKAKTITLKASENPITRQNALAEKNGQTYVEALKKDNAFTAEAQKEAFNQTFNAVMAVLTDDAKEYLTTVYGDLNAYITTKIEAEVKLNKTLG